MSEKYTVYIAFGEENSHNCQILIDGEGEQNGLECNLDEKVFDTKKERDAYLEGVADMSGWFDYQVFSEENAKIIQKNDKSS